MRKVLEAEKKLLRPHEVMEWFWTDRDLQRLPFTLDEEDEHARLEPCKNALVQLETGEHVGLQYAYGRNAMALLLAEGQREQQVIEQVLRELNVDVGRIMRASNPPWDARSLLRRASMAADRGDGATTLALLDQALPMMHRANENRPNVDALIAVAEVASRVAAYGRAEALVRAAILHSRNAGDEERARRAAALLDKIAKDRGNDHREPLR